MRTALISAKNRMIRVGVPDEESVGEKAAIHQLGLLASQVDEILPECITYDNIHTVNDLELRSIIERIMEKNSARMNKNWRFLFLTPIGDHGYNFGQYRIASHLVQLGIPCDNIELFPLRLDADRFDFSYNELRETIERFCPNFICEIAYIGWENQIADLNRFIKEITKSIILMGGPLTTSHTDFCVNQMAADIIILGHGEYLLEYYLKAVFAERTFFPETTIPGVLYINRPTAPRIPFVNRCLDALHWDPSIMVKFCRLTPIINLFTSDVCYGNCVFCYRSSYHENNAMSTDAIIQKMELLLADKELKKLPIKYVRFFDDDFFAVQNRNSEFLEKLSRVLAVHKISVYELTFSVRSFMSIYKNEAEMLIKSIDSLNLKRVTIGVDGFNDTDLKVLQKGYRMSRVFELSNIICKSKTRTLMYAILTSYSTSVINLVDSLENMISLVSRGNTYIGPTITPTIYVHSNNKKLYPSFSNEKFMYLDVQAVSEGVTHYSSSFEVVMSAAILPKDWLVRRILRVIGNPTKMESAYLIPLMNAIFRVLAIEENFLIFLEKSSNKVLPKLERSVKRYQKRIDELQEENKQRTRDQTINYINKINDLMRKVEDTIQYIDFCHNPKKIHERIKDIHLIIQNYAAISYDLIKDADPFDTSLAGRIKQLCQMPLVVYQAYCKNSQVASYKHIELNLSDEERRIFERLL